MVQIRPFRAIRPAAGLEKKVAALPYDVYNRMEAEAEVIKEPLSFLSIDRAETQFGPEVDTYADCVYEKAAELLNQRCAEGVFIQEQTECFYLYELEMNGRIQTGIVACASVDDYMNGVIKKHENTRRQKEEDRIRHVDTCNAQTGPIFLAYRANEEIRCMIEKYRKDEPIYDFVSVDGIAHRVWIMENKDDCKALQNAFAQMKAVYIADGHHRCASAVHVAQMRREQNPAYTGQEEFNFFLSVLFSDDQLMIMDYNRVVRELNGLSPEEMLEKTKKIFRVEEMAEPVKPEKKGVFGMYLAEKWYRLTAPEEMLVDDPVEGLDVSVLQNNLLKPVLGIQDPRTDKRIDFVGGIRGIGELELRCHDDCLVAFSLYPTSIHELFQVADADLLMPPKSTWFEPKLRSGLFIHDLK